ncbi:MAG TPA: ABC transporter permease [Candidatus Angelobacter sp.]|nr:ABC transporter permease [Candidatus Angelobacter sp.]
MLFDNLRYVLRGFRKRPGIVLASVLTLAIAIAICVSVFSTVDAVLLKPLPYPKPDRIVFPWRLVPAGQDVGYAEIPWGLTEVRRFWSESRNYEAIGAFKSDSFNMTGNGEPVFVEGIRASSGFFSALGINPILGRVYSADEDKPGNEHEVVLGYHLWQTRFSSDEHIPGRTVDLNGQAYTVLGVMPENFVFPRAEEMPGSFEFPKKAELWVPLALPQAVSGPADPDELAVVGRLKPQVTLKEAQSEMDIFSAEADRQNPRSAGWFRSRVTSFSEQVSGRMRQPLLLLLSAVLVVLGVACSNVANLFLARSIDRRKEFSLREALGARNSHLFRLLFTESYLLSVVGGIIGLILGELGIILLKRLAPVDIPRIGEVAIDWRVLLFVILIVIVCGIAFGLLSALSTLQNNVIEELKESGPRASTGRRSQKLRDFVLVGQIALALVLTMSAALLTRTFSNLLKVNPGFQADKVLTFELSLPPVTFKDSANIVRFYRELLDKLNSLGEIKAAGLAETVPMNGAGDSTVIRIIDHPTSQKEGRPLAGYNIVSPRFFAAIGTSLHEGRLFEDTDTATSQQVVIVNEAMAKKYWPNEDPIGKQVGLGNPKAPVMAVVGVIENIKKQTLHDIPGPEMYVPYTQNPWPSMLTMQFAVRTADDPALAVKSVQNAVLSLNPDLPLAKVATLKTLLANSLMQPKFSMILMLVFAISSLFLAAIGIYGVMSYSVAQRTQEIGIRMALGAQQKQILALVVGNGLKRTLLGVALGLTASFGAARAMETVLYGMHGAGALIFTGVSILLLLVSVAAAYIPAMRATKIDPLVAFRQE